MQYSKVDKDPLRVYLLMSDAASAYQRRLDSGQTVEEATRNTRQEFDLSESEEQVVLGGRARTEVRP